MIGRFWEFLKSIFKKNKEKEQQIYEEILAEDIMVDRSEIEFISESDKYEEVLEKLITSQQIYFPICGDSLDDIKGSFDRTQFIKILKSNSKVSMEEIKKSVTNVSFVPEKTDLNTIADFLFEKKVPLLIVVDGFGSTQGVITHDSFVVELYQKFKSQNSDKKTPKELMGTIYISGLTEIEELWFLSDINFKQYESKTIGGFLMEYLGKSDIPKKGYQFILGKYDIKIIDSDERQINKVSIRQIKKQL